MAVDSSVIGVSIHLLSARRGVNIRILIWFVILVLNWYLEDSESIIPEDAMQFAHGGPIIIDMFENVAAKNHVEYLETLWNICDVELNICQR